MKTSLGVWGGGVVLAALAGLAGAAPLRVAVLDFENRASAAVDAALVGGVEPKLMAEKGVYSLGKTLANRAEFVLIDNRDFLRQLEAVTPPEGAKPTTTKPSFVRAAQALNADLVLKGILLSYQPGKRTVNQGGYKTEFITLTVRIGLQALDTRDAAVIAMTEGVATKEFRQSDAQQTQVGEDDLMALMQAAIENAVPAFNQLVQQRLTQDGQRTQVKLTVKTDADPALVEIDGILMGTTPLQQLSVYEGDHLLTVGKAGYQDVSKKILLKSDTTIEVPLLKTQLSADEMKTILEKSRVNVVLGTAEPALILHTVETETPAEKGK